MKRYAAKKGIFSLAVMFLVMILPIAIFLVDPSVFMQKPFVLVLLFAPIALVVWIWMDTHYKVDAEFLYYKSAFLAGKIPISEIRKIELGKTLWVGMQKPALATKGLIIHYQKYEQLYVAPKSNAEMVAHLQSLNPEIEVV